jgi:RNA polymerase sigma-70 factor (ECF subfamily)
MRSDAEIEGAHLVGKTTWRDIDLTLGSFASMVRDLEVPGESLRTWGSDLYLACAAGEGRPRAVQTIDHQFVQRLEARIRRLGSTADTASDALQAVRERLFAGPSPRIRAYNAAGPLAQWIKVVAIRTAIDLHRATSPVQRAAVPLSSNLADASLDPTTAMLKRRYKAEFEQALRIHLARLSSRDRTVLRLHLIEGLSVEKIGTLYQVHRVTIARWIWTAGEALLEGVRQHFRDLFGIVAKECDSLAGLMRSEIALDLPRLLAD